MAAVRRGVPQKGEEKGGGDEVGLCVRIQLAAVRRWPRQLPTGPGAEEREQPCACRAAPPPEGSRRGGEAGWPDSVVHGNALASRSTSKRVSRHWWEHYLVLAFEFMCGNGIRRGEPGLSRDRSLSICSPLVALASSVR